MSCEMIIKGCTCGKACKVRSEADEKGKEPSEGKPWLWTPLAAKDPASRAASPAVPWLWAPPGAEGHHLPGQGGLPPWRAILQRGGRWEVVAAGGGYTDPLKRGRGACECVRSRAQTVPTLAFGWAEICLGEMVWARGVGCWT